MSVKTLRVMTVIVGILVVGIVASFVGSLYTGVQDAKKKHEPREIGVPKPALPETQE